MVNYEIMTKSIMVMGRGTNTKLKKNENTI